MVRKLLAGWCFRAGRWFVGLGNPGVSHAYRWLRLSRALWPANPLAAPWLGYLDGLRCLQRGRPDQALDHLLGAARGLPEVAGVRARLGVCLTMLGRDEEAIATLERVLHEPLDGLEVEVYPALAWSYLRSGRAVQAVEVWQRAAMVETHSRRLDLVGRLASGVVTGGLSPGQLREDIARNPQGTPLLLEYAHLQARDNRHRLARAAVLALPEEVQPRSYAIIGQSSLNGEDHKTALWAAEQLEQYDGLEPRASAAMLRSEVALRQGDGSTALSMIRQAIVQWPGQGLLHEQLGRVLLLTGQWDAAVEEMIEALHGGLSGALAAGLAALAALEIGDTPSARGVFVIERPGDGLGSAFAHAAQARLKAVEGRLDETLRLASWTLEEMEHLPAWAAQPLVTERLAASIRIVLQAVRDGGDEGQRRKAAEALDRLIACTERCSVMSHPVRQDA